LEDCDETPFFLIKRTLFSALTKNKIGQLFLKLKNGRVQKQFVFLDFGLSLKRKTRVSLKSEQVSRNLLFKQQKLVLNKTDLEETRIERPNGHS
jgi:hypothetical protein